MESPEITRIDNQDPAAYLDFLCGRIESATSRVWLKVPWIKPTRGAPKRLCEALANAHGRGVDVRILVRPEASNQPAIQRFQKAGVPHRCLRYLHEKELLADDRLVVFSANFTPEELGRNNNHAYEFLQSSAPLGAAEACFRQHWETPQTDATRGEEVWADIRTIAEDYQELLGQSRLNPMQNQFLPVILGTDANVMVSAPTGSGKTLLGEAAVLKAVKAGGKAVYTTPARALTGEISKSFRSRWDQHGIVVNVATGESDLSPQELARSHVLVATVEKFESIFRQTSSRSFLDDLRCVVVDEVHEIGDSARGPILESLVTRLKSLQACIRLVALSATVANSQELAEWLNAELVSSQWRPTRLTLQVLPYSPQRDWLKDEAAKDEASNHLIQECVDHNLSTLVFCGSKPKARRLARVLAKVPDRVSDDDALAAYALRKGVGLHYRGLPSLRDAEKRFRSLSIKTLVATSTVAQGVNLPAHTVVIRDTTLGQSPLTTDQALQMAGRAGRPGQQDEGLAYLLTPTESLVAWKQQLAEGYQVDSRLHAAIEDSVLAEVLRCRIQTVADLSDWYAGTLAAHQRKLTVDQSEAALQKALDLLCDSGLVRIEDDKVICTPRGRMTSRFLISAKDAAAILTSLIDCHADSAEAAEARVLVAVAAHCEGLRSTRQGKTQLREVSGGLSRLLLAEAGPSATSGTLLTLLAAHIALVDPTQLDAAQGIAGVPTGTLRERADELSRHLAWLSALGEADWLDWVPAVANDLACRIKWRKAKPPRGSGRAITLLEASIPEHRRARELPKELRLILSEQQELASLAQQKNKSGMVCDFQLLATDAEQTGMLHVTLHGLNRSTYPLACRMSVTANSDESLEHMPELNANSFDVRLPGSSPDGTQVLLEAIAYGRYDWAYGFTRVTTKTQAKPFEEAKRAISGLPVATLVLPLRGWLTSKATWLRNAVRKCLENMDGLDRVASTAAGSGSMLTKALRLADFLRDVVQTGERGNELSHPALVLRRGRSNASSWAICYAALCRAIGIRSGIAQHQSTQKLVALARIDERWYSVQPNPNDSCSHLSPVLPEGFAGAVTELRSPAQKTESVLASPKWAFLEHFRKPADNWFPESQADPSLSFDEPTTLTDSRRAEYEKRSPGIFDLHPRAYSQWSTQEDEHLVRLTRLGLPVEQIAGLHGRQLNAIRERQRKLLPNANRTKHRPPATQEELFPDDQDPVGQEAK